MENINKKLKDNSLEERFAFLERVRECSGQSSIRTPIKETLKAIHEKGAKAGKK